MPGPRPARAAVQAGLRAAAPLAAAAFPFGLAYGAAVSETNLSSGLGIAASFIILAGAAQLSLVELIDSETAWVVAVTTALVINARFVLYSAALAPAFSAFPSRWRYGLPYLMTDQAASLALARYELEADPVRRRWFYFAGGLLFASMWWVGTIVGVGLGASLPESLDIAFAVPLMFLALAVPTLTSRPAVVAAVVAGVVTVVSAQLPNSLNILAGSFAGIACGRGLGIAQERRALR